MPPLNKPYPTFYWSAIVNVALSGSDVILPVKYDSGFFTGFLPTSCKPFFVYKQCFSALVVWQL